MALAERRKKQRRLSRLMDRYQNIRKEVNGKSEGGKGSMNFKKGEKRKERVRKEGEESICKSGNGSR